jgi:hypothetical protein
MGSGSDTAIACGFFGRGEEKSAPAVRLLRPIGEAISAIVDGRELAHVASVSEGSSFMWRNTFLRSVPGRLLRVAVGGALFWTGVVEGSIVGLVLMMIGLIPMVTGIANVCLLEDVVGAVIQFSHPHQPRLRHKS